MPTLVDTPRPASRYFKDRTITNPNRGGRPTGAKNKLGASVRWNMLEAFRLNGGIEWMTQWAKENPDLFMPMLTKLLPHELAESGLAGNLTIVVQRSPSDKPLYTVQDAPTSTHTLTQPIDVVDGRTPKHGV